MYGYIFHEECAIPDLCGPDILCYEWNRLNPWFRQKSYTSSKVYDFFTLNSCLSTKMCTKWISLHTVQSNIFVGDYYTFTLSISTLLRISNRHCLRAKDTVGIWNVLTWIKLWKSRLARKCQVIFPFKAIIALRMLV